MADELAHIHNINGAPRDVTIGGAGDLALLTGRASSVEVMEGATVGGADTRQQPEAVSCSIGAW